jgi:stage V sporulation protein D (sporulation-specific penicillin-binding protein)
MRRQLFIRIRIITFGIFLFALVLILRLYFVQIVHGEEYARRAENQYIRPTQQSVFDRGSIFFTGRDGTRLSAATLRSGYILAMVPAQISEAELVYKKLSEIIDIDKQIFLTRAARTNDSYEEIANHISEDDAKKIRALSLSGIALYPERWRNYPAGELAAHTIGFLGFVEDDYAGRYGLERYYEDVLDRSSSGADINFFAEIFSEIGKIIFSNREREGDIVTTIDPSVQAFLESTLSGVQTTWGSKQTSGVIMDPTTGSIYSLGVMPSFNPNTFGEEEDISIFSNPLIESVYEMGSIMKPLTMASGIDAGAVTAETEYVDNGYIEIDGYTISNFDQKGRGRVNMQEVLNQSLNTGVAFVVSELGERKFAEYMQKLRLGDETGIDLPNEGAGLVENLKSPRKLEYTTAAFGQGIALTPIGTVRALSVLANGGVLTTPHIASKIEYKTGLTKNISYPDGEQVFKGETTDEVTRMLVEVVDKALLGGTVSRPNYSIAAKTGTAQIAKVGERGYYDDRFLHSFFGYFPAYNPRFFVFLYTVEPKGVRYASQTLTNPFMEIIDFLINHYEIPPDR